MGTQREGGFLINNRRKINKFKKWAGKPKGGERRRGAEEGRKVLFRREDQKLKGKKNWSRGNRKGIKNKMKNEVTE